MSLGIKDLAHRVREEWRKQGISVEVPEPSAIPESVRDDLPNEFVMFLTEAGLPEDGEMDAKLFRFWPPQEWITSRGTGSDGTLLVFADYLIDSHRVGVWILGKHRGSVSLIHDAAAPPLGSFAQFLQLYLDDDPALYG